MYVEVDLFFERILIESNSLIVKEVGCADALGAITMRIDRTGLY